jgi:hypothetical protein
MSSKKVLPDWKAGQVACAYCSLHMRDQYVPKEWYFVEIVKIIPAKTNAETIVEVFLYSVPETYPEWENERLKDMYPSLVMSREMVMLARIAAGIKPHKENRFGHLVRLRLSELCPMETAHFLKQLTGERTFSARGRHF